MHGGEFFMRLSMHEVILVATFKIQLLLIRGNVVAKIELS